MTTAAERDAHLHQSAGKVRARLEEGASRIDLVVLPELSSIDYSRETFARLDEIAEPLRGASFEVWSEVAKETKSLFHMVLPDRQMVALTLALVWSVRMASFWVTTTSCIWPNTGPRWRKSILTVEITSLRLRSMASGYHQSSVTISEYRNCPALWWLITAWTSSCIAERISG